MADETPSPQNEKVRWARFSGLLRDLATPLTVAIVGLLASIYVNRQQALEANQRAFAELVSQRESADTNLRIEMFKTVLEGFLRQGTDAQFLQQRLPQRQAILSTCPLVRHVIH